MTLPTESGSGTTVVGNYIYNNAGEGARIHGLNSIIQGNHIEAVTIGVTLACDKHYSEGTFPQNMTVSLLPLPSALTLCAWHSSMLSHVHGAKAVTNRGSAACLQIRDNYISNVQGITVWNSDFYTSTPLDTDISIINNTIANTDLNTLAIASTGNLVVANNTFVNTFCGGYGASTQYAWAQSFSPVALVNITGLTYLNNTFVQGPTCTAPEINWGAPVQITGSTNVVAQSYPPMDTLNAGQSLSSPGKLFSANGQVFLGTQSDGNLVLYNTSQFIKNGGGAIWQTLTYGKSSSPPFTLTVQQVRMAFVFLRQDPLL